MPKGTIQKIWKMETTADCIELAHILGKVVKKRPVSCYGGQISQGPIQPVSGFPELRDRELEEKMRTLMNARGTYCFLDETVQTLTGRRYYHPPKRLSTADTGRRKRKHA